ncbi:MAG: hypothetical protein DRP10_01250 [Candidatus Aenigmatarchaeota archaeon]|nr:MAG: hypothetical protein DRP10_01250 [Candidatus Aenigmarchaeota archaeon]
MMVDELAEWLHECREVFPKLNKYKITCEYGKLSKNVLGCTSRLIRREISADDILLFGESRKPEKEFEIKINEKLKKIERENVRKEIVQYIMVHELLHLENKDLSTLSKNYKKRKKKKIHVKEFDNEVFERYNKLRELKGLSRIQKIEDLEFAIHKIISKI